MANVILDFVPQKGYTKLHIYEAATKAGAPGALLETITVDPDSPPTRYTTQAATSSVAWFSIQWEDARGGVSPLSDPVQGGTYSLVSRIVDRALLRDSSLDEAVVTQEAEALVNQYFQTTDAFSVDPALVTSDQLTGLTYMAIARAHVATLIRSAGSSQSYTAGLVSQKAGDSSTQGNIRDMIDYLLREANKLLGWNYSVVMLMEEIDPTGMGTISSIGVDQSRLLISIE